MIKCNFDASIKKDQGTGLGVIFWDDCGGVLAVDSLMLCSYF